MLIIAIETSCDETSVSLLKDKKILSHYTISQVEHSEFLGVMPSLAARLHLKNIEKVFFKAIEYSNVNIKDIDFVAYTNNPGLIICLQIGKIIAETISLFLNIPLIACNHLLGHAYSTLINKENDWSFPAISLILSGGHTRIYKVNNHLDFFAIGETLDDSIGECLDKVSTMIGYSYPGGPIIEKLALKGNYTYKLPIPKNDSSLDFSFSGLKSEIKRIVLREKDNLNIHDLSFSLQSVIINIVLKKISISLKNSDIKTLIIGGGVIVNNFFRSSIVYFLKKNFSDIKVFIPDKEYCTDNAAMIGTLAYYTIKKERK